MTTFDERETAFENKFAHDEEMKFRAQARCNKMLGLWAVELLGRSGDEAETYARSVVAADFEEPGQDDVVRKLVEDLGGRATSETIRSKMAEFMLMSKDQLLKDISS
ncbi:MAG: DUF1476 domain-containing protein [Pelagimonas sp.]